jgi:hypothetical protein
MEGLNTMVRQAKAQWVRVCSLCSRIDAAFLFVLLYCTPVIAGQPSAADFASIQDAIDANPGTMIFVPHGDYEVTEPIRITTDRSGLYGYGRVIQTNSAAPIVQVEQAAHVQLLDLQLTRSAEAKETTTEAILAINCDSLHLERLEIRDNQTDSAAISLRSCVRARVQFCTVHNYMRISVDDRTGSADWGYAFKCINGSGIRVSDGQMIVIWGNRIIEQNLRPTSEIHRQHDLGRMIKKTREKGAIISQATWDRGIVDNWHQGSAIEVSSPTTTANIQVIGNQIENAAQGIDIHADHVIVSQNIVSNAFIGMKAMHGSRHVLIIGNQFSKNDLWSIGLMPGAASHSSMPEESGQPARQANVDAGSIIANNIISEFGYGDAHWIWKSNGTPIRLDAGQKPENPPLTDVIVQGNIVYDTDRDYASESPHAGPRYAYTVLVAPEVQRAIFVDNLFHPGRDGISNRDLKPPK